MRPYQAALMRGVRAADGWTWRFRHSPLGWRAVACAMLVAAASSNSATSSTIVSVTVPSATSIGALGCQAGVSGRTDFGVVLPNTRAVTSSDCVITFGSSNDTARLTIRQSDAGGSAMFSYSTGQLDAAFDGEGHMTLPVAAGSGTDVANDMVRQPDGKLVLAGYCDMGAVKGMDMCAVRLMPDGSLDTSFDSDGIVTAGVSAPTGVKYDDATALDLQSDGKLVMAGRCEMDGTTGIDFCAVRLDANGLLDPTFDGDGRMSTGIAPAGGWDAALAMVIQTDSKIVIGGECDMTGPMTREFCITRYGTTGALDTSFGGDGIVTTPIGLAADHDTITALALQPNGQLVALGRCNNGAVTGVDFCVARYAADGSLDTTFDGDGIAVAAVAPGSNADQPFAVTVQPDGKILTAGYCDLGAVTGLDFCLVRFLADGSLDTSFDGDGRVVSALSPGTGTDAIGMLELQADGRILAAGSCDTAANGRDSCLARYRPDGSLDSTFGAAGVVRIPIAPGAGFDSGRNIVLLPDGGIATSGRCDMGATGFDLCAAKYAPNGSIQQYNDGSSDWNTSPATSMFGACLRGVAGSTALWSTTGTCSDSDGPEWTAVTPAASSVASTSTSGTTTATVNLRFGMRAAASQRPGAYVAPITFDVIAPAV